MVEAYFDRIEAYKQHHDYMIDKKLVASPKRAAFMAVVVMTHRPFASKVKELHTLDAALANEILAWRLICNLLELDLDKVPPSLEDEILYNLRHGIVAPKAKSVPEHMVTTWLVTFMYLLQQAYGETPL
jgi:hypothetical protein